MMVLAGRHSGSDSAWVRYAPASLAGAEMYLEKFRPPRIRLRSYPSVSVSMIALRPIL